MATSDDVTEIKLRDDNAIEVGKDIVHRGWAILRAKNSTGHSIAVSASPAECDALIAAIGRALGRPAPTSTPLEERLAASLRGAQQAKPFATDQGRAQAIVEVWERALAMVREQGATVPRAAVEALRARLLAVDSGMEDLIIDAFDALLAPPTTPPEKA